jgi:hypothetical protein
MERYLPLPEGVQDDPIVTIGLLHLGLHANAYGLEGTSLAVLCLWNELLSRLLSRLPPTDHNHNGSSQQQGLSSSDSGTNNYMDTCP